MNVVAVFTFSGAGVASTVVLDDRLIDAFGECLEVTEQVSAFLTDGAVAA